MATTANSHANPPKPKDPAQGAKNRKAKKSSNSRFEAIRKVALYYFENPKASQAKAAEDLGINVNTLMGYRRDQRYLDYFEQLCKEHFNKFLPKAIENLQDLLEKKHWQATRLVLEGTGVFSNEQTIKVKADDNFTINIISQNGEIFSKEPEEGAKPGTHGTIPEEYLTED